MFSKRNMFKINPPFPQENFHVRAGRMRAIYFTSFFKGCEELNIFHCF
eukprot:UN02069